MKSPAYAFAIAFIGLAALGRVVGILVLKFRQARYAREAVAVPRSWRDLCTAPEPYLLGGVTIFLLLHHRVPDPSSAAAVAQVAAGFLLALVAVALMLWALRAFPSVSTGHYVLPDQRVISDGPYSLVRHPLYLAAFLVWLSLAVAFGSLLTLAVTLAYVIPSYVIYMRAEEEMLLAGLGEPYRVYRERVGMLLPRARRRGPPPTPGGSERP
jgi:protein-S-isoprenylcysteine O-methyltransferase Ste14